MDHENDPNNYCHIMTFVRMPWSIFAAVFIIIFESFSKCNFVKERTMIKPPFSFKYFSIFFVFTRLIMNFFSFLGYLYFEIIPFNPVEYTIVLKTTYMTCFLCGSVIAANPLKFIHFIQECLQKVKRRNEVTNHSPEDENVRTTEVWVSKEKIQKFEV